MRVQLSSLSLTLFSDESGFLWFACDKKTFVRHWTDEQLKKNVVYMKWVWNAFKDLVLISFTSVTECKTGSENQHYKELNITIIWGLFGQKINLRIFMHGNTKCPKEKKVIDFFVETIINLWEGLFEKVKSYNDFHMFINS